MVHSAMACGRGREKSTRALIPAGARQSFAYSQMRNLSFSYQHSIGVANAKTQTRTGPAARFQMASALMYIS